VGPQSNAPITQNVCKHAYEGVNEWVGIALFPSSVGAVAQRTSDDRGSIKVEE
jgi:hypothetical protein